MNKTHLLSVNRYIIPKEFSNIIDYQRFSTLKFPQKLVSGKLFPNNFAISNKVIRTFNK